MTRSWLAVVAAAALLLAIVAAFWRESNPPWQTWQARHNARTEAPPVPVGVQALVLTRTGDPELCLTCHVGIEDISPSHPAEAFGCVVCHGGEPLALDADRAHATMRGGRNPSDLSVAAASCGQADCHGGYADEERNHVDRVLKSLQATYAGGIAVLRFTFGAQPSPAAEFGIHAQSDQSKELPPKALAALKELPETIVNHAVDPKFRQNCLNGGCHPWSAARQEPYYYRGSGCAACHYPYAENGLYQGGDPTIPADEPGHGAGHRLTTAITYTQCNHCHNRGNYSLKQMTFLPRDDLPSTPPPPATHEADDARRLSEYYQPLAQFTKCEYELDCADCHTAQEVMGDGHLYGSKKDAQYVQCQTCHGTPTTTPRLVTIREDNELAMRRAWLAGRADFLAVGDRVIETARGELLWWVKESGSGRLVQVAKANGEIYDVPLVRGSKCEQDGQSQTSGYCHQCHAVSR